MPCFIICILRSFVGFISTIIHYYCVIKYVYFELSQLISCMLQAAVWLKYGECLNAIGELQGAVKAYQRVVELAPSHLGARVSLSGLQQHLGRPEEALEALRQSQSQACVILCLKDCVLLGLWPKCNRTAQHHIHFTCLLKLFSRRPMYCMLHLYFVCSRF